jgi:hypothetical protein
VTSVKAQKKIFVFPAARLTPFFGTDSKLFFTADSAIVSLTMVIMGFDKKKRTKKESLPTDPIILRHATGNTHLFFGPKLFLN